MIQKKNNKILLYVCLHIAFLFLAGVNILTKKASLMMNDMHAFAEIFSLEFIAYCIAIVICLGIYAIVWQQILKRLPLVTAYCNKPVIIFWSFLAGAIFFNEVLTINMLIGGLIVIVGIYLVVTADKPKAKKEQVCVTDTETETDADKGGDDNA